MFLRLLPLALVANGFLGTPLYLWIGDAKGAALSFVMGVVGFLTIMVMGPRDFRRKRRT